MKHREPISGTDIVAMLIVVLTTFLFIWAAWPTSLYVLGGLVVGSVFVWSVLHLLKRFGVS